MLPLHCPADRLTSPIAGAFLTKLRVLHVLREQCLVVYLTPTGLLKDGTPLQGLFVFLFALLTATTQRSASQLLSLSSLQHLCSHLGRCPQPV